MTRTILEKIFTLDSFQDYEANFADLPMTAADVANGNRVESDGSDLVVAYNSGAGAHTITITSVADAFGRYGHISYSLGAGEYAAFGPLNCKLWKQDDGFLYLSADHAEIYFGVVCITGTVSGYGDTYDGLIELMTGTGFLMTQTMELVHQADVS